MDIRGFYWGKAVIYIAFLLACVIGTQQSHATPSFQKILASDGSSSDAFGRSLSISGDTALVGADGQNANGYNSGAAYVFVRDADGSWSEQAKLTPDDGAEDDRFGMTVSIDGDTAVVGAQYADINDQFSQGAVYIFVRDSNGVWTQQAKLIASDGRSRDYFGNSVSVSGDTVLVGAQGADSGNYYSNSGAAYVFVRDSNSNWTQQAKLIASDASYSDEFGSSVSLDGNTALIGAHTADVDNQYSAGAAYIFLRDNSNNWTQQAKLSASDAAGNDEFGSSVSLSGETAIIGAPSVDVGGVYNVGAAYIFVRDSSNAWSEKEKLSYPNSGERGRFGDHVAISGDTALIGAPFRNKKGLLVLSYRCQLYIHS